MSDELPAIEERTSSSGRVTYRRDGRGFTVTIRQLRRRQRLGVGALLLAVAGFVALIVVADQPAATGALLVPIGFCLLGLYYYYLRRQIRIRVSGTSVRIGRWFRGRPTVEGLTTHAGLTSDRVARYLVVRIIYEGELLIEMSPIEPEEVAMMQLALGRARRYIG